MAKFERAEFKSKRDAADYIVAELAQKGIEATYGMWGSCPILQVSSLGLLYIRPNAIEPHFRSWSVTDEDYADGLWPEEVVEKIVRIRDGKVDN
jgi:hypothetical protein